MKSPTVARTTIVLSSLSLLLAIVALFISDGSKAEGTEQWHPLSELVSPQQLTQIIADNTAPSADRLEIANTAVGLLEDDLLVIDFKSPQLCGRGGCSIVGYRASTGEQVLSTYALQTGADQPIVELVDRAGAEFPCLLIAPSLGATAQGLTRDALCYRDGEWLSEAP
jgi:hypothetical protein